MGDWAQELVICEGVDGEAKGGGDNELDSIGQAQRVRPVHVPARCTHAVANAQGKRHLFVAASYLGTCSLSLAAEVNMTWLHAYYQRELGQLKQFFYPMGQVICTCESEKFDCNGVYERQTEAAR
jgi:hypothetical protein